MKKLLIGLTLFASIGAQAECYWGYVNHNLDRKIQNGIMTLGVSALASIVATSGVEKALELITESIVLEKQESTDAYLRIIEDSMFGKNLEKILKNKTSKRLDNIRESLIDSGVTATNSEIAKEILDLSAKNTLCKKDRVMSHYGSYVRYKTFRDIKKILKTKLKD